MDVNNESLEDKCMLIAETFNLPILFVNPKGKVIYENMNHHIQNPLYENQKEKFFSPFNFKSNIKFNNPIIRKSVFSEKYLLVSVIQEEVFKGTVIIGPSLSSPLSEDVINGIVNDSQAFFYREKVFQYYKSLPLIEQSKLANISAFVFYLFHNELISPLSVDVTEVVEEEKDKLRQANLAVSEILHPNALHHNHLFEKKILYIIREGRVEDLKEFRFMKEEEDASLLSKSSYLRSVKNHIITLITLVSRASIEGGLHEETAFALHDRFINNLEELHRLDEIRSLAGELLYTFAEKVKQVKDERFSKTIILCKDYIFKHIYDEITHDDIAENVELSPKYLSVLFKKEVGMTISDYIQQSKMEEAKKLLSHSNTPISEICSLLNYNDQSYFTKVFKKNLGTTPNQYRKKHHLQKEE